MSHSTKKTTRSTGKAKNAVWTNQGFGLGGENWESGLSNRGGGADMDSSPWFSSGKKNERPNGRNLVRIEPMQRYDSPVSHHEKECVN